MGYFSGEGKDSVIRNVVAQLVGRNGKELGFNHFLENLSAHPDFLRNNFDLYTFRGICFESPRDSIVIAPTGFATVDILPKKNKESTYFSDKHLGRKQCPRRWRGLESISY